jgi:hypothetical protein
MRTFLSRKDFNIAEFFEGLIGELEGSGSIVWGSLFPECVFLEFVHGVISGGKLSFEREICIFLL